MKKVSCLVLALVLLASCATKPVPALPKFNRAVNCSPRALEWIKASEKDRKTPEHQALYPKMRAEVEKTTDAVQKCYQTALDEGLDREYNVCVVLGTSVKGVLDFIDIEDHSNSLPLDLHKCMLDEITKVNLRGMTKATIGVPFILKAKAPAEKK